MTTDRRLGSKLIIVASVEQPMDQHMDSSITHGPAIQRELRRQKSQQEDCFAILCLPLGDTALKLIRSSARQLGVGAGILLCQQADRLPK
jgi:hypothetical protein